MVEVAQAAAFETELISKGWLTENHSEASFFSLTTRRQRVTLSNCNKQLQQGGCLEYRIEARRSRPGYARPFLSRPFLFVGGSRVNALARMRLAVASGARRRGLLSF